MGRFTEDCREDRSLLSGSWPEAYDSPELGSRPCYLHASSHTHQVSVCCGQPEDRGFRQPESSAAMRNSYHHQHDHVDIGGAISAPASTWWLPCFQPCLTLSCLLPVSQPGFYAHPVRVTQLWEPPQQGPWTSQSQYSRNQGQRTRGSLGQMQTPPWICAPPTTTCSC